MKRMAWAVVALCVIVLPLFVTAADEVQFGSTVAYWYPGDIVRIPVLFSNDSPMMSWGIAFRSTSGPITVDSVTPSGRLSPTTPVVVMVVANVNCTNDFPPLPRDSGYLLCALTYARAVPAGSGEVCSIWLHGLPMGTPLSFDLPPALVAQEPGTCVESQVTKYISTTFEDLFPVPHSTNLVVMEAPLEIAMPAVVSGQTLKSISIPIEITSFFGDPTVSVVSFEGPSGALDVPQVSGAGSLWQVNWTPGLHGQGAYLLTVRALNEHGQSAEKSVAIAIVNSVLSGDIDCNGNVDLSDLTRMINWLLTHTLPPVCP